MPGVIELDLDVPAGVTVYPARLHGAACAVLGLHEPVFSVSPMAATPGGARWRIGWLPDRPPELDVSGGVRIGPDMCPVVRRDVRHVPFAELAAAPAIRAVELQLTSPLWFSRNGRDYALPDPVLVVDSLIRRWNDNAPVEFGIDRELRERLRATVYLTDMDGRTERGQVSATMYQIGFVGYLRLALTRVAAPETEQVLAALMQFAAIAGIGAQTTHGFGAVELLATVPVHRQGVC